MVRAESNTVAEVRPAGELMPYQFRGDATVTLPLMLCVVLCSYIVSRDSRYIAGRFKEFFSEKKRGSMFNDGVPIDIKHVLLLLLQTCLMFSFCSYYAVFGSETLSRPGFPHVAALAVFMAAVIVFVILKLLAYMVVNMIFFEREAASIWIRSYLMILLLEGVMLLPVVLLVVFFNISTFLAVCLSLIVVVLAKFSLLYKCVYNFFDSLYGIVHLILYFCALEILPGLMLWKGFMQISSLLV